MKAMRLADSGATAVLVEENVPQPQPGRGELLIQEAPGALSSGSIGSALMFVLFINSSILQQKVHR
jgi:hypothetical protein